MITYTILILTANPIGEQSLDLDKEVACIIERLQAEKVREQFVVVSALAVTPSEVRTALLTHQPIFLDMVLGNEGLCCKTLKVKPNLFPLQR